MQTPYPAEFPFESVKIVVEDIRTKTTVTDRQKFSKALWELVGYALKSTLGEGDLPFSFTFDEALSDDQVADYLSFDGVKSLLLPWRAILKWCLRRIAELL